MARFVRDFKSSMPSLCCNHVLETIFSLFCCMDLVTILVLWLENLLEKSMHVIFNSACHADIAVQLFQIIIAQDGGGPI